MFIGLCGSQEKTFEGSMMREFVEHAWEKLTCDGNS